MNPIISELEPLFERDTRFPTQDLTQFRVIAVPATDAHRLRKIIPLGDSLTGGLGDNVHQFVDRHEAIGAEIQGIGEIRPHEAINALDAVVDITIRARLFSIAPYLDGVSILSQRQLAADGGGRLFASAVVRAERTEDIVEAHDACL